MSDFGNFDIEIQDNSDTTPEQFSGTITTAGTAVTITPANAKPIQYLFVNVPGVRDPLVPNAISDAIYVTIDGTTKKITLMSGESQYFPGNFSSFKLDTNANGTTYQAIVWS